MEHRYCTRLQNDMQVALHSKGRSVIHCKAKNIGRGGIFVNTGRKINENNRLFKVEFEMVKDGIHRRLLLPAVVIHVAQEGLGLMFVSSDADKLEFVQG